MLEFSHGYTYPAHPIACAEGLVTLDVLEDEDMLARVRDISPYFESLLHGLQNCPCITDIRNYGLAGGISLEHYPGEPARRPFEVAMKMWEKGFDVRYGADTIPLALAFTVEETEMDDLVNALADCISR